MTAMWTKGPIVLFSICVLLLLVVNRANEPQVKLTTLQISGDVEVTDRRGGTVSTGEESGLLLQVGDAIVELSENTDVRLDRLFENDVRLFVARGRVSVSGATLTLTTDRVAATGSDFELVNYDFQERVTVEPTEEDVTVVVNGTQTEMLRADEYERIEISELEPFTITRMKIETSE